MKIDLIKTKIALWLLSNRTMTATSYALSKHINETKCVNCGKNPFWSGKEEWGVSSSDKVVKPTLQNSEENK